jgi:Glycosyl hydrolase family 20, catalytic domain/beta-acetyl hexosaminidase like
MQLGWWTDSIVVVGGCWLCSCTCLLLSAVVAAANSPYIKWHDSAVWPCVNVEVHETNTATTHSVRLLLRTLHLNDWEWQVELRTGHSTIDAMSGDGDDDDSIVLELLDLARERFNQSLQRAVPTRSDEYPFNPDHLELVALTGIRISIDNVTAASVRALNQHNVDESYEIRIPYPMDFNHSWIDVHAGTVYGAMHGLTTLSQLLHFAWMEGSDDGDNLGAVYGIRDTPLYISDAPAYPYRGFMMDTARHYLPLDLILLNLQVMAANKLNTLHWHLTDSQSWPYQSHTFAELSAQGAYCADCVYTAHDIQSVVAQAAVLGIRVIVEIDLPGHSQGTSTTMTRTRRARLCQCSPQNE